MGGSLPGILKEEKSISLGLNKPRSLRKSAHLGSIVGCWHLWNLLRISLAHS